MNKDRPLLSVRSLTVRKGTTILLNEVSFDCVCSEMKGVFGPSGAGKSTLLHAIAGVSDPTFTISGHVIFGGVEITNESADARSHRGMAIVLQGLHLFPDLTVLDNVSYPLRRRGLDRSLASGRALQTLRSLHIEALANRRTTELSGGQQQRVALARAIIYKPSLLLLDEPFKGLEQELRDQLLADICMQVRTGIAVLLVTHEKRELRVAADSIIELRQGRIVGAEQQRRDGTYGGFQTTMDALLVPSGNGQAGFVQARLIGISLNGSGRSAGRNPVIKAQVMDRRRTDAFRAALLIQYESGQAGWIEVPYTDAAVFNPGQWIDLQYVPTTVQESKHA